MKQKQKFGKFLGFTFNIYESGWLSTNIDGHCFHKLFLLTTSLDYFQTWPNCTFSEGNYHINYLATEVLTWSHMWLDPQSNYFVALQSLGGLMKIDSKRWLNRRWTFYARWWLFFFFGFVLFDFGFFSPSYFNDCF